MKANTATIILTFILLFIVFTVGSSLIKEKFSVQRYETYKDAEFRGINLMGVNSNDTFVGASCESECQNICARNDDCVGYAWYRPGNRCYLYGSGGFVFGRTGFNSGIKI